MKLTYKDHALEQMAKRSIGPAEVEATLVDCDVEYPSAGGDADVVRIKNIDGRDVKVYFKWLAPDHILVCTTAVRDK